MIVKLCDRCHKNIATRDQENNIIVTHEDSSPFRVYRIIRKHSAKADEPVVRTLGPANDSAIDLCNDCYDSFVKFVEMRSD